MEKLKEDYNKNLDYKQYPINPNYYESQRLTDIAIEYSKNHPELVDPEDNAAHCKVCCDSGVGISDNGVTSKLFICTCEAGDTIFH